jgi:hypothetical protein
MKTLIHGETQKAVLGGNLRADGKQGNSIPLNLADVDDKVQYDTILHALITMSFKNRLKKFVRLNQDQIRVIVSWVLSSFDGVWPLWTRRHNLVNPV